MDLIAILFKACRGELPAGEYKADGYLVIVTPGEIWIKGSSTLTRWIIPI